MCPWWYSMTGQLTPYKLAATLLHLTAASWRQAIQSVVKALLLRAF